MVQKFKSRKRGKKSFYEVEAPMTSVNVHLYGASAEEMEGKVVKLDLTKSLRGRGVELLMKVKHESGKLSAEPVVLRLSGSYVKNAVRKGTDYVEDSFDVECRDFVVRVKPFLVTRRKVSRAVRRNLRNNARKYLEGYLKVRTAKELFSEIITNKLQKGMAVKLKKVYPLVLCEIRIFEKKREKENSRGGVGEESVQKEEEDSKEKRGEISSEK